MNDDARGRAAKLSIWSGTVEPEPLTGGITNTNFTVVDRGEKFVVRIGDDIPVHGVLRVNELAASRAAFAAGVSPEVVYAEPGVLVLRFIDGKTYAAEDVRRDGALERIVPLVKRVHTEIPNHFAGATPAFWVFQVLRDYRRSLRAGNSRMIGDLPRLESIADELEDAVGPVRIVFGHNDLLPANFIDSGDRLWLVDWDYAGFNSPLFDLANLASNNELNEARERWLLETYFESAVDDRLWHRYSAMKCASLLREGMWSMISEIHSTLEFDYVAYTAENMARFERAYTDFRAL
ncbi:MAG: phosphotransferase [Alphaproteobacteria bacterium]|nr:phosphotransferase [Alphaproteobacteria bacterium]